MNVVRRLLLAATAIATVAATVPASAEGYFYRGKSSVIAPTATAPAPAQPDTVPDAIAAFPAVSGAGVSSVQLSPTRQLTGHDGTTVSVSGSDATFRVCAAANCSDRDVSGWGTAPAQAARDSYVQLRAIAPASGQTKTTVLTYGGLQASWSVTSAVQAMGNVTPGTSTVAVREGISATCGLWNGRTCELPLIKFDDDRTFLGKPNRSQYHRIYSNGGSENLPTMWCVVATGSPTVNGLVSGNTGRTGHNYRLTQGNTSGESETLSIGGLSETAFLQTTNNAYYDYIRCAGWN